MTGRDTRRWPAWATYASVAVAIVVLLGASGLVLYRVFAPTELRSPARTPYPTRGPSGAGVVSELWRTPLIVDDRLRVYAGPRQVWADGPTASRTETTPHWSFRRWPQQVTGVVLAPGAVVSEWSDGVLVALDTATGEVLWRTEPRPGAGTGYAGRRTGAATVYDGATLTVVSTAGAGTPPAGTTPTGTAGPGAVVVALDAAAARGYDPATGRQLWRYELGGCRGGGWSGAGVYALACADLILLDPASGRQLRRWRPPGAGEGWRATPVACAVGRSACRAMRTYEAGGGRTRGWLVGAGGAVTAAPALDPPTAWLAGDVVVDPAAPATQLSARHVDTGASAWTWTHGNSADRSPATVLAAAPDVLYLLTHERTLVGLDPASGHELTRFTLNRWRNISATTPDWRPGHVYVMDRFMVVERLHPTGGPADDDNQYYYSLRTVLVTRW